MEQNTTNEVIGQVVEETMTKSNDGGKTAGILLIGAGLGVGVYTLIKKVAAKIRAKKEIVIEQTADDTKEENSDKE